MSQPKPPSLPAYRPERVERIRRVGEGISRGNFEQEVREATRSDEIGALARSIERMTKSLRIALSRLSEKR